MRSGWRVVCSLFGLASSGCFAGHNSYTLPTPAEGMEVVTAVETTWVGGRPVVPTDAATSRPPVVYPQLGARLRLAEDVDVGVRGSSNFNLMGLRLYVGGDVKWRFLDARFVQVAALPGVRGRFGEADSHDADGYPADSTTFYSAWLLEAPVLVAFAPADWLSVVLSPALVYGIQTPNEGRWHGLENEILVRGVAARAGLGLDFRVERGLAVHPQFTLVRTLREGDERTIYTAGLGFRFMMAKRDPPAASRTDRDPSERTR
jgi:hypothetical protein